MEVTKNVVSTALTVCKVKSAGLSFETLLSLVSTCGGDIGNIGHGRNQFPDIIDAAYHYVMKQTIEFLQTPLLCTGLCPHIAVASDKSTPGRETNHAIMIIIPFNGKRIPMPIDAPLVYEMNDENNLEGGSGEDLAYQITDVLKKRLKIDEEKIHYIRAFHADGQYQCDTFQSRFKSNFQSPVKEIDPFVLLPWDTSHWMDLAMEKLYEDSLSSSFLKQLVTRANRFNTMFRHGKGHEEYKGLADSLGLKSLEVVGYSTTRFFSSSYEQWDKIYHSYPALIETYKKFREQGDNCDETRYQIRGQDFAIDICGAADVLRPIVLMMVRCQAVDLPLWKVPTWFHRMIRQLESTAEEVKKREGFCSSLNLTYLGENWKSLTANEKNKRSEKLGTFKNVDVIKGWLVTDKGTVESEAADTKKTKKKQYTWKYRSSEECLSDLVTLAKEAKTLISTRFDSSVDQEVKDLAVIFDLENTVLLLKDFKRVGNKLKAKRKDITKFETNGAKEFESFYKHVCQLPQVESMYEKDSNLDLLPHHASSVLKKYRSSIKSMVFETHTKDLFTTPKGEKLKNVSQSQLVEIKPSKERDLTQLFTLTFENGISEEAIVAESKFAELLYTNEAVYTSFGKEVRIALDVALRSGGCEAIVEGFYSLVKRNIKRTVVKEIKL
uniref:Uncharacterized protein n=2 Tax=Clytia hemisphaerica TaxID=252671 RepID=A0A7M6DPB1_9CNID